MEACHWAENSIAEGCKGLQVSNASEVIQLGQNQTFIQSKRRLGESIDYIVFAALYFLLINEEKAFILLKYS